MVLKDKVALITGSSSGIGRATAVRFAKEGCKVVVNYRQNKLGGEETLAQIKEIMDNCLLVQADVSKENDVKRLFQDVVDRFGTVDILVNNAAIGTDKRPFMEASYDDFQEMIQTDITSVFMCSQQAALLMQRQGYGKILNTSSIRGWESGGRAPVYAAMKAAVNSFTKSFAKMVAPNIHVNAVAPGFVKTRSYDTMPSERITGFIESTYLKRWVTEDEIADAFIFLAKNDAMTGQVIYVDAGFTLK
ncbi:MAG: SDR family oxidoreductase [Candidatus Saccharimonadales bacterium]